MTPLAGSHNLTSGMDKHKARAWLALCIPLEGGRHSSTRFCLTPTPTAVLPDFHLMSRPWAESATRRQRWSHSLWTTITLLLLLLDTAVGTWTTMPPTPVSNNWVSGGVIGSNFYVVGGCAYRDTLSRCGVLSAEVITSLPSPRAFELC